MIKMIKMIMMISTDLYPRVTCGPGAGTTCLPRDHRWSGKSDLLGRNSNTVLHLHFFILIGQASVKCSVNHLHFDLTR